MYSIFTVKESLILGVNVVLGVHGANVEKDFFYKKEAKQFIKENMFALSNAEDVNETQPTKINDTSYYYWSKNTFGECQKITIIIGKRYKSKKNTLLMLDKVKEAYLKK